MIEDDTPIYTAIHGHRLLRFWYRERERIVEPYAYGVDSGGKPILRAYQVAGAAHSGVPAWKLFRVEEIEEIELLEDVFGEPRPGYMRNDPSMTKVYAEL